MKLRTKELVIYAMLGALMYISKMIMEILPNIHLLAVLTITYTIVYRKKALYPIYVFVIMLGALNGFSVWWVPHLYLWILLWGVVMLLPKKMPKKIRPIVYMVVCGLHGLLYGALYAPAQALFFGMNFEATLAWIVAGLPWDAIHGISNLFFGILIVPMASLLTKLEGTTRF